MYGLGQSLCSIPVVAPVGCPAGRGSGRALVEGSLEKEELGKVFIVIVVTVIVVTVTEVTVIIVTL